jgi:hypothetical protein
MLRRARRTRQRQCRTATLIATAAHNTGLACTSVDSFRTSQPPTDVAGREGHYLQAGGRWFEPSRAHQAKPSALKIVNRALTATVTATSLMTTTRR